MTSGPESQSSAPGTPDIPFVPHVTGQAGPPAAESPLNVRPTNPYGDGKAYGGFGALLGLPADIDKETKKPTRINTEYAATLPAKVTPERFTGAEGYGPGGWAVKLATTEGLRDKLNKRYTDGPRAWKPHEKQDFVFGKPGDSLIPSTVLKLTDAAVDKAAELQGNIDKNKKLNAVARHTASVALMGAAVTLAVPGMLAAPIRAIGRRGKP